MASTTDQIRSLLARNAGLLARARAEHAAVLDAAAKQQGLELPNSVDPQACMDAALYRGRVARLLAAGKS